MTARRARGGSRYLYDSFDATHARIEANERVAEERWVALEFRLNQIEGSLERVERRIWLTVYSIAGFMLAQGLQVLIEAVKR